MEPQESTGERWFITDRELAPKLNVSLSFLQKDRIGPKRIPFVRLGDRVLYDEAEARRAVLGMMVGGPRARRGRRAQSVDDTHESAAGSEDARRGVQW